MVYWWNSVFVGGGTHFGILLIVVLLGSDPSANQVIPHGVGESKVVIPSGRHISVLDQREVEVSVEILFQLGDVFHAGKASHRDLFLFVVVRQGFRHSGSRSSWPTLKECKQRGRQEHTHAAQRHSRRGTHGEPLGLGL